MSIVRLSGSGQFVCGRHNLPARIGHGLRLGQQVLSVAPTVPSRTRGRDAISALKSRSAISPVKTDGTLHVKGQCIDVYRAQNPSKTLVEPWNAICVRQLAMASVDTQATDRAARTGGVAAAWRSRARPDLPAPVRQSMQSASRSVPGRWRPGHSYVTLGMPCDGERDALAVVGRHQRED